MINTLRIYEELAQTMDDAAARRLASVLGLIYEDLQNTVTKTEFGDLHAVVQKLAEAHERIAQTVGELAEAQKRTEQRVDSLAVRMEDWPRRRSGPSSGWRSWPRRRSELNSGWRSWPRRRNKRLRYSPA